MLQGLGKVRQGSVGAAWPSVGSGRVIRVCAGRGRGAGIRTAGFCTAPSLPLQLQSEWQGGAAVAIAAAAVGM